MPLPVISNVFRCALHWEGVSASQHAVNVLHVRAEPGPATETQVYNCLNAHVTAAMWNTVSASAGIDFVTVLALDGTSAGQVFSTGLPAKWVGAGGGDPMIQVAGLIKLTTGLRGPRHRGRLYLPFTSESVQTGGVIAGGTVSAVTAAWTTFSGAIASDGTTPMDLVVASYVHADASGVIDVQLESETATQRRRQTRNRA